MLSGRVHPGESPASYMIDGLIDFLCSDHHIARKLRDIAVFKVVPMLNPDGVATGNHRKENISEQLFLIFLIFLIFKFIFIPYFYTLGCNLAGHDLNRTWGAPSELLSPTIYHWKQLISMQIDRRNNEINSTSIEGIADYVSASSSSSNNNNNIPTSDGVSMFCDFHAHSRSFNIFMYGCECSHTGNKTITNNTTKRTKNDDTMLDKESVVVDEKIFPYLLSSLNNDFSFKDCDYRIQGPKTKKANCGRIVVRKQCGVMNSYTVRYILFATSCIILPPS